MVKEYRADVEAVKKKARSRAEYLVRTGAVKKPAECELCGRDGHLEKHHPDYTQPDLFQFWCVRCHRRFHRCFSRRTVFELFPCPDIIDYCTQPKHGTDLKQ